MNNHLGKLNGALWDRIDVQVEVPLLEYEEFVFKNMKIKSTSKRYSKNAYYLQGQFRRIGFLILP